MDTGYEVISDTDGFTYASNGAGMQVLTVTAPAGKKVVGGGGYVVAVQNWDAFLPVASAPQRTGALEQPDGTPIWNAWTVLFTLPNDSVDYEARVYAICVNDDF